MQRVQEALADSDTTKNGQTTVRGRSLLQAPSMSGPAAGAPRSAPETYAAPAPSLLKPAPVALAPAPSASATAPAPTHNSPGQT